MKRMILVLGVAGLLALTLVAQTPAGTDPPMMDCAAMMQKHEAMQKHMAEMDAKVQALVADMNNAEGSAKVDKTAAVVTELVSQRSMMQKQMTEMMPKMMGHMTQHMNGGKMKGMGNSMSSCPMMKGADKTPAPPAAEHKHPH